MIMDAKIVVGVGNIYAADSLFSAKIHPKTPANQLTLQQCNTLVACIKKVLLKAIGLGGSTLRDFTSVDGSIGSYASQTQVYGKSGKPCPRLTAPTSCASADMVVKMVVPTCGSFESSAFMRA